ncbi:MAG TPA: DUF438 domain-containing protein [Thermoleophilia bacterium]|nr:DUF438 domain-containing protein [Thermoleophilia bacterium]
MTITAQTKVHELCDAYPYMRDWLAEYAADFKKLKNPVLYNTVGRVTSLETAASMAGVTVERFLDDVRQAVAEHEIVAQESAGAAPRLDADERVRRQVVLKDIIKELHDGASVAAVKARFDELVRDVDASEVAHMEQALIAEGLPVEEVQRLCDVHVTVFKESLDSGEETAVADDHPVAAYRRENAVIAEITSALRGALEVLVSAAAAAGDAARRAAIDAIAADLARLAEIDVHYLRKENQLFPVLERYGVVGPTKVMWALDDDIRSRIKVERAHASRLDAAALAASLPETLKMIDDMIYKEEKILFPTSLQVIAAGDWAAIAAGDADIGYAWIEGPSGSRAREAAAAWAPAAGELLLPLTTGALSPAQVDLMLRNLPFDITYVDADDRVRYYSEGERVFPRSPAAIGREVRNCHPPKSLDKVEQILAEFKAGTKDMAEFWIDLGGTFVHIRYFALRDGAGAYQGCLEVVQDATHVRGLTGQRRIVDW